MSRRALGKGLGALIPTSADVDLREPADTGLQEVPGLSLQDIPVEQIDRPCMILSHAQAITVQYAEIVAGMDVVGLAGLAKQFRCNAMIALHAAS